jgi:uncharacterized surface protein with fasciclin (FAS1) repeats
MSAVARRSCVFSLAAALVLLGSAACGDSIEGVAAGGLREPSVDSSDTRAHRLMGLVKKGDTLSTLARALQRAKLAGDLRQTGPYTLFAPTDRAFQQHWPSFDRLLAPAATSDTQAPPAARTPAPPSTGAASPPPSRDSLRNLLQFHLVRGRFTAADIADSLRLSTLAEGSLLLERANRTRLRLRLEGTPGPFPVRRTVEAQNGVIHVLPRPLRPPAPDTTAQGALDDTTAAAPTDGTN